MKKNGGGDKDRDAEGRQLWKAVTRSVKAYTGEKKKPGARKAADTKNSGSPKTPEKKPSGKTAWTIGAESPAAKPAGVKKAAADDMALFRMHVDPRPRPRAVLPAGFDKGTETKLKKGKLPLEGRIDLHGMTQDEAHRALQRFIPAAAVSGRRTLLVITGKGKMPTGGVLRRMVPIWLSEGSLATHVLAITPAQPKDGGDGALYVRLRKPK